MVQKSLKKYNLKADHVRKIARKLKKGGNLCAKGGRPWSLDEISVNAVEEFFLDNPDLSDRGLKSYIVTEHRATKVRRCPAFDIDSIKRLLRRSINRYAVKVQNKRYIYELAN